MSFDLKCLNHSMILPPADRIIAIGDIHGDFNALMYCLLMADVIDDNSRWIGGNTHVVQTGDLLDDCRPHGDGCYNSFDVDRYDEILIIEFLTNLNAQAIEYGGKILLCMGNHDFVNTLPDNIYNNYKQHKYRDQNPFLYGGQLARKFACIFNLAVFIGDWVFLHGGLRPHFVKNMDHLSYLNRIMKLYLMGNATARDIIIRECEDNNSVLFDRVYSDDGYNRDEVCEEFRVMREMIGNPNLKMVVGHTTHNAINGICNNITVDHRPAIYRIDVKLSRAFGAKQNQFDRISILEIIGDQVRALSFDGYIEF